MGLREKKIAVPCPTERSISPTPPKRDQIVRVHGGIVGSPGVFGHYTVEAGVNRVLIVSFEPHPLQAL